MNKEMTAEERTCLPELLSTLFKLKDEGTRQYLRGYAQAIIDSNIHKE